ncbi:GntR family transcriptional regulator [Cognatishimia sp. WU-CL00825]|uniref:GntR family transcriptional regulator n=1 Tax=Cognatishimia sp. WU-CL00825 TaxID=3127658 RepID=UPI0031083484
MADAEQRVLSELRQLILEGEIGAGEKISEVVVAQMLGVSRTPAKLALARLESTGLVEKRPGRGYTVREVKLGDVEKILMARGVLEGTAAGYMATNGASEEARRAFSHSLRLTEAIVAKNSASISDVEDYQTANTLFHTTIMEQCGNEYIMMAYDRIRHLPLAELGAVASRTDRLDGEFLRMSIGHAQHAVIHDAIMRGDAMRAEMVMREHSNATLDYARLFVGKDVDAHIPTLKLASRK